MSEILIASNSNDWSDNVQYDSAFKIFTGTGHKATRAEIYVCGTMMNGHWTGKLELCTVSGGQPGSVLASVDIGGEPYDDYWCGDSFSNGGVVLQSGVQYALRFTNTFVNGYAGMQVGFSSGSSPENALAFNLYGVPSSIYGVAYDGNGSTGGSVPTDSNSYAQGATVTVKANTGNLVKTNNTFVGWATTSSASTPSFSVTGSIVNPSTFNMPASNVTLYAVWQQTPTPYTITYNGNGNTSGTAPTDNNNPYNSGSTVTVLGQGTLTKTNYTFQGWATSSGSPVAYTQGQTFTINQNTTLYAVWQQTPTPTYIVTYNGNGNTSGSTPSDPYSPYKSGDTVGVLANTGHLLRSGYAFLGWSTNQGASSPTHTVNGPAVSPDTFVMSSGNVVLYAVWQSTPNSGHMVTYDANRPAGVSGTGSVPSDTTNYSQQATVTVKANPNNLTANGYDFRGWAYLKNLSAPNFGVNGTTVTPSTFQITSNVTLFAIWQQSVGGFCDWNNVPFIHLKGDMILNASTSPTDPKQFIEIRSKPYDFINWNTIIQFMRTPDSGDWIFDEPESAALKFKSNIPGKFGEALTVSLFQVNFDWTSANSGIACTRHFVIRKDLFLNGMLQSIEGAIVLHAGKYRQWEDPITHKKVSQYPTIHTGGMDGNDYNQIHFRNMTTGAYVPIRPGFIIDKNGNTGAPGQVLKRDSNDTEYGGLIWSNSSDSLQAGVDQTDFTTGICNVWFKQPHDNRTKKYPQPNTNR
ncbi:MAG: InlB B-repeat-containing protein [Candidatus Bathyarchaeota archaeon]|nr:InlB B-repeat-containing protein [Candidatus Termiticorpusculum sp.]